VSNITGWSRGLQVSGGGRGVVSHAGLALLRHLADRTGLAGGLSRAWRMLTEIAGGGTRADKRITAAVNTARRHAWAQVAARHGALPGVRLADKILDGVVCIRLDATVTVAHSDKQLAEPNFKGYGLLTELRAVSSQFSGHSRSVLATVPAHGR